MRPVRKKPTEAAKQAEAEERARSGVQQLLTAVREGLQQLLHVGGRITEHDKAMMNAVAARAEHDKAVVSALTARDGELTRKIEEMSRSLAPISTGVTNANSRLVEMASPFTGAKMEAMGLIRSDTLALLAMGEGLGRRLSDIQLALLDLRSGLASRAAPVAQESKKQKRKRLAAAQERRCDQ